MKISKQPKYDMNGLAKLIMQALDKIGEWDEEEQVKISPGGIHLP